MGSLPCYAAVLPIVKNTSFVNNLSRRFKIAPRFFMRGHSLNVRSETNKKTLGHKQACTKRLLFVSIRRLTQSFRDYSTIVATLPEPTVLPPSRIANVRPCSIAIGWISSMLISTLSPGMHISVPSGRLHTPVTSVVLK